MDIVDKAKYKKKPGFLTKTVITFYLIIELDLKSCPGVLQALLPIRVNLLKLT